MTEADFETQWQEVYPKVCAYYFKRIEHHEDAQDLTLASLEVYFRTVAEPQDGNHYGLLWTIVRNKLVDFYRRSKIVSVEIKEYHAIQEDSYWDSYHSSNYQQAVERIVQCVKNHASPKDYDLVKKIYLEDMSTQHVAQTLNISYPALRKRLSRIIKKLRVQCKELWPARNI